MPVETHHKIWLAGGIAFICAVTAFVIMTPSDWQARKPRLSGRIWVSAAESPAGEPLIHFVTEEERTRRTYKGLHHPRMTDWFTMNYTRYHIHTRSARTAAAVKDLRVGQMDHAPSDAGPEIIGCTTGTLWLWTKDGLQARDGRTLAVKLTDEQIHAGSGKLASILPRDRAPFRVSKPHQAVVFKGGDTAFYQIDPLSGKIAAADLEPMTAHSYMNSAEEGFRELDIAGDIPSQTEVGWYLVDSFLTQTGVRYALMAPEQRARLNKWPGRPGHPMADVARTLYKMPYKLDNRDEVEINPDEAVAVGNEKFVLGGFLTRGRHAVWDVPDPSSTLVLCKDALGEAEPWQVVRLARDGTVIYRQSTGLSNIVQLGDSGSAIVMRGQAPSTSSMRAESDRVVIVEPVNGKTHTFSFPEVAVP